jgi:hypothetical protein
MCGARRSTRGSIFRVKRHVQPLQPNQGPSGDPRSLSLATCRCSLRAPHTEAPHRAEPHHKRAPRRGVRHGAKRPRALGWGAERANRYAFTRTRNSPLNAQVASLFPRPKEKVGSSPYGGVLHHPQPLNRTAQLARAPARSVRRIGSALPQLRVTSCLMSISPSQCRAARALCRHGSSGARAPGRRLARYDRRF